MANPKIQFRRGTAGSWSSKNPTLSQGEPGLETDTGILKIGDGTTPWNDLEGINASDSDLEAEPPLYTVKEVYQEFTGIPTTLTNGIDVALYNETIIKPYKFSFKIKIPSNVTKLVIAPGGTPYRLELTFGSTEIRYVVYGGHYLNGTVFNLLNGSYYYITYSIDEEYKVALDFRDDNGHQMGYVNGWLSDIFSGTEAGYINATFSSSSAPVPVEIEVLNMLEAPKKVLNLRYDTEALSTTEKGKLSISSTFLDGGWVKKEVDIAYGEAASSSGINYSLSSYLPEDEYNYEVLICGWVISGNVVNNIGKLVVKTDICGNLYAAFNRAYSTTTNQGYYSLWVPIGPTRVLTYVGDSGTTGTYTLKARGYRRIGTNK